MTESNLTAHQSDPANRARLRWRSRRGLLENDIILTRFLDAHETELTDEEVDAFTRLLDLSDNDQIDLAFGLLAGQYQIHQVIVRQIAFTRLVDVSDNDLMDLVLARKEPEGEVDLPHVHAL